MKHYVPNGITPEIAANLAEIEAMSDDDIDLSDMPEITDWSGAIRAMDLRKPQQEVLLRLDTDLLRWFITHGDSAHRYPERINAALRSFVEQEDKPA